MKRVSPACGTPSHSSWNTGARILCGLCRPTLSRNLSSSDEKRAATTHLRTNGCVLRREGKGHSLWENPQTGHAEAIPRHTEIANLLAKRICRKLAIPDPPG
jgi:mRNA interferase HicA